MSDLSTKNNFTKGTKWFLSIPLVSPKPILLYIEYSRNVILMYLVISAILISVSK